jgi:hypothetical protein
MLDALPEKIEKSVDESLLEIKAEILAMETLLNANAPLGDCILRIHRQLKEKPELAGMLSQEDIMRQVKGLKSLKLSAILEGKGRKSVKSSYSEDDLDLD